MEESQEPRKEPYAHITERMKGTKHMDGVSDKINVNLGDGMGGMGGLVAAMAAGNRGADGLGLGGGLIGGVLLGALLGRNGGLFGNNDGAGAGLGLQNSGDTNAILQGIGDIKASVPLAEAQVQLALAGSQAAITGQANTNTQYLSNNQTQIQLALQAVQASLARDIASVDTNVDRQSTAIQMAIKDDGERTRSLITSNQIATLNQQLTAAQNEVIELRAEQNRAADRHGVEINMINNQNQNQLQFQQQAQVLNQLASALVEVGQIARATNTNLIVGNTGATTTGAQTANPVNVRA